MSITCIIGIPVAARWTRSLIRHADHMGHRRLSTGARSTSCKSMRDHADLDDSDHDDLARPGPSSLAEDGEAAARASFRWGDRQELDPGLYLVATPIGNLQDMTLRALTVLRSVSMVLAEDTRHTGKLLSAFGIRTPMASYHSHNEEQRTRQVVERLTRGEVG